MAAFTVGTSYLGGPSELGGGEDGMNTGFDYFFPSGEVFPYVTAVDTSGFDYYLGNAYAGLSTEPYPAIYYIAPASSGDGVASRTTIAIAIGIGL